MTERDKQALIETAQEYLRLARLQLIRGNEEAARDYANRAFNRVAAAFRPSPDEIWRLLEVKDAIINVEGWMTRKPGEDSHLKIETITRAAEYREGDLEKFFGIDPDFTGDMTTGDYLDSLRGTDDYLRNSPDE